MSPLRFGERPALSCKEEYRTFCLVFQRWMQEERKADRIVELPIQSQLQELLFVPDLNIDLHDDSDTFHLRAHNYRDELRAKFNTGYEFSFVQQQKTDDDVVKIQCIDTFDTDSHMLRISTTSVHSEIPHYMNGYLGHEEATWEPTVSTSSARDLVTNYWLSPNYWVQGKQYGTDYVIVRPGESPKGARLSELAQAALKSGYSMLLFLNKSVAVPLVRDEKLKIAGMVWRDDNKNGLSLILTDDRMFHFMVYGVYQTSPLQREIASKPPVWKEDRRWPNEEAQPTIAAAPNRYERGRVDWARHMETLRARRGSPTIIPTPVGPDKIHTHDGPLCKLQPTQPHKPAPSQDCPSLVQRRRGRSEWPPPVKWEWKGKSDGGGKVQGPFTSRQIMDWIRDGYFVGENAVPIRMHKGKVRGHWFMSDTIDFEKYLKFV